MEAAGGLLPAAAPVQVASASAAAPALGTMLNLKRCALLLVQKAQMLKWGMPMSTRRKKNRKAAVTRLSST